MKTLSLLPVLALLLVAGCATRPSGPNGVPGQTPAPGAVTPPAGPTQADLDRRRDFDAALDKWNGASTTELQAKMGKPNATAKDPDGTLVWAYVRSTGSTSATDPNRFSCTVRFLVDDKTRKVRGHRIEGC
ncbi:hypothetical protein ACFJGW_12750 [Burkholderiaceae bacterium UC74_6]